jgi:hypothetical protein
MYLAHGSRVGAQHHCTDSPVRAQHHRTAPAAPAAAAAATDPPRAGNELLRRTTPDLKVVIVMPSLSFAPAEG